MRILPKRYNLLPRFVCISSSRVAHRPLTCSVANLALSDFFPACESHLDDRSFARRAAPPAPPASTTAVPQSEIDKVTAEYQANEKKKKEKESASSTTATKKGWIATGFSVGATGFSTLGTATTALFATPEAVVVPVESNKGKAFILHRDIFAMRVEAAKRKVQAKAARERIEATGLPSVPKGMIGVSKDVVSK